MSLNASSCASAINTAANNTYSSYPSSSFPTDFASIYKSYSQAGVLSAAGGAAGSENSGIISSYLNSFTSATNEDAFAQMLADYWATCMLIPSAGSISVSNNAASKVSAFKSAILASITTTESTPYYQTFITNIENVVKTIQWTCIKPNPLPPTVETIS